jgi:hypothetical protein
VCGFERPAEDATHRGVTLPDAFPGPTRFFAASSLPWTTAHTKLIGQQNQTKRGKERRNNMGSTKKYGFFEPKKTVLFPIHRLLFV